MSKLKYLDLLGLQPREVTSLIDRLDARGGPWDGDERREHERFPYRGTPVPVSVRHTAGGTHHFLLSPRDISTTSITMLHGGFLNSESICTLALRRADAPPLLVTGHVIACRHIERRIHEVVIRFHEAINLDGVVDPSVRRAKAGDSPVKILDGKALCIFEDEDQRDTIRRLLETNGMLVETAHCAGAGVDQLVRSRLRFELVVVNLQQSDVGSDAILKSLRRSHYCGPIVGFHWGDEQDLIGDAGETAILSLPLDEDVLLQTVVKALDVEDKAA